MATVNSFIISNLFFNKFRRFQIPQGQLNFNNSHMRDVDLHFGFVFVLLLMFLTQYLAGVQVSFPG